MRELAFCTYSNKVCGSAVQLLFFINAKVQLSSVIMWLYSQVCVRLVENPKDQFSHDMAHYFVSSAEDPECQCGHSLSEHSLQAREGMLLSNGDRWDKKTHTTAKMTNAFGEIEFVGYGGNIGKVSFYYFSFMIL